MNFRLGVQAYLELPILDLYQWEYRPESDHDEPHSEPDGNSVYERDIGLPTQNSNPVAR